MTADHPERRNVAQQIAHTLSQAIVAGALAPGDSLPSERALAERYDVNRSSIREALRRLEAWGLVEIRHGGATRVRDYLLSAGLHLLPQLASLGRLDSSLLRDLHEIRAMLLCWCAEQAARKADDAAIERLRGLAEQMAAPTARTAELQELDYDFFHELVTISGNRLMAIVSNVVREVYMVSRRQFSFLYRRGVFDPAHHRKAVAALARRDGRLAAEAMRAHALSAVDASEGRARRRGRV